MVIDRRKALVTMMGALGRVARGNWGGNPAVFTGNSLPFGVAQLADSGDNSQRPDLSQIRKHIYSEEGIPMFLGCEDTAAPQTRAQPSDLNRKVASAFERYAQEWSHLHPDAAAGDAAKLVEFLAGRDFKSGGLEASL